MTINTTRPAQAEQPYPGWRVLKKKDPNQTPMSEMVGNALYGDDDEDDRPQR